MSKKEIPAMVMLTALVLARAAMAHGESDVRKAQVEVEVLLVEARARELEQAGVDYQDAKTVSRENLEKLTEALRSSQSKAGVVANPRISTIDGEEASLTVGQTVHYMEEAEGGFYKLKEEFDGTKMTVTPNIDGGAIHVALDCQLSERAPFAGAPELDIGVPIMDVRSTSTQVKVKSGETVVLGGLTRNAGESGDDDEQNLSLWFLTAKILE